jgi:hypothetical protein
MTELDMSSFDTSKVTSAKNMFVGCAVLSKVTIGEKFNWVGTNGYLPAQSNDGDNKWYNIETGAGYEPASIPVGKATYVSNQALLP